VSFHVYWVRGAGGENFRGRVTRCYDGDTVQAAGSGGIVVVRMWGVDAPERGQPLFEEARRWLRERVRGRVCEFRGVEMDNYGRQVARVVAPGVGNVGLAMVRAGLAWWYRMYAPGAWNLREAERDARRRRLGIWGTGRRAIAPWVWRRFKRS
jgi:endonuclease YncB( thermonuclease family)